MSLRKNKTLALSIKIHTILISSLILLFSCTGQKAKEKKSKPKLVKFKEWHVPKHYISDNNKSPIVATVNGEKISVKAIENEMIKRSIGKKAALNSLISKVLLYQEHVKGKTALFLSDEYKSQAVYHIIKNNFEKNAKASQISDKELKEVYDAIQANKITRKYAHLKYAFVHSEWRIPAQMIIRKQFITTRDIKASSASIFRLIKSWHDLTPVHTEKNFRECAWLIMASYFPVSFENKYGAVAKNFNENFYRIGYDFNQFFKKQLFEIKKESDSSNPFFTRFGVHWVFLKKLIPAANHTFEEVKNKLRDKLALGFKSKKFRDWLIKLTDKYKN